MRVDVRDELLLAGVDDEVAERLREQLIGRREVLFAMPEQHTRPAVERGPGRRRDQRGLAETGLTRDQEHLPDFALSDALVRIHHRRRLGLPAHHPRCGTHRQTPRQRDNRPGFGPVGRLPQHLDGLDRIRAGPSR